MTHYMLKPMDVSRAAVAVVLTTLALVPTLVCASGARADARSDLFSSVGVSLTGPDGTFDREAGGHPDLTIDASLPIDPSATPDGSNVPGPGEALRSLMVDLPDGFVGNPSAFPTCTASQLSNDHGLAPDCPVEAQVGEVTGVAAKGGGPVTFHVGLYNLAPSPDVPASFGFNYQGAVTKIDANVRPEDYGISSGSASISQALAIESVSVQLWGVPSDPSHDAQRQVRGAPVINPSTPVASAAARKPFLTNPKSCTTEPVSFSFHGDTWEHPGVVDTRTVTADPSGTPFIFDRCDQVPFSARMDVQPLSRVADAPTGLDVSLTIPQSDDPDGLSTSDVRSVKTVLPPGTSVSPSSAAGLGACAPSQIRLGTNDAPTCPDSSKIGTVTIDTPLLADPLQGDVILASQNDNPFRSLIAMYIAVKGPGFYLKLPGKVDLDQATGQVTATFDNTPQLPFTRLHLQFNGGSTAPLANPQYCGNYNSQTTVTPWSGGTPVVINSPMTIDQGCDAPAFAPSFTSGSTNPLAGQYSAFTFSVTRADRQPYLARINAVLPPGLLAQIGSVPQCDNGSANAGTCPASSQIGSTTVLSGPGAQPLGLTGQVYLTGPYVNPATGQNAPFGLSIAVPTAGQAGPFDLGVVVVRAGLYVDRTDAHVTVKADPLPTIIQGIPLRLRQVNVSIDRPKFMINPTSCAVQNVFGTFGALGGGDTTSAAKFQVGGCGDIDLQQKLSLQFTGKSATKDGQHPGVVAKLTDPGGGANLEKAEVKLPLSVALDPDNAEQLCTPAQRAALNCPKSSIVGKATATSVLKDPLTGPVYFVIGQRKSPSGRIITTLPKLWIPLSADGVTIDVNADSDVDSIKRLVTTFHDIPDAPIKSFNLTINGGKHGILVVSGKPGTCKRDKTVDSRFTGQNDQVEVLTTQVKVDGCKPAVKKTKISSSAVSLRVENLGAGKLTVSGGLVRKASRTLKRSTEATITAKLTASARAALKKHGRVKVALRIGYRPAGGKAINITHSVVVRH